MHFSNGRFSNKETGFSGPYVVGGLLGAAGEKKRENQMFLQDLPSFAPLHTQIFVNFSFVFLQFFPPNFIIFANFESISRVFEQILMKICRNFTGLKNASQNFGEISNFDELGVRGLPKKLK